MGLYVLDLVWPVGLNSVEELLTTSIAETLRRSEPFADHHQHRKASSCRCTRRQVREMSRTRVQLHDKKDKPEGKVGQIRVTSSAVEKGMGS